MNLRKFAVLGCLLTLAACGSSSSSSDDSSDVAAITSIDGLPKATSPVVGADGSLNTLPKSVAASSVSKLNLGDYDEFDFSSSSRAACEAGNMLKESVSAAAQGDLILCYVQNITQQNIVSGNLAENVVNDGEFHVFSLAFGDEGEGEEGGGGPSKVRMKITKVPLEDLNGDGDTDDEGESTITDFVMQACGDGGDDTVQSEYLHQAIDGSSFTMNSKGIRSHGMGSDSHETNVVGTLNASGQFTEKTITIEGTYDAEDGSGGGRSSSTVTQNSTTFTFSGAQAGEWGMGTYENRIYFQAAVDDTNEDLDNYDIGLLGYGAGAVQGAFGGTFDANDNDVIDEGESYDDGEFSEAWDANMAEEASNDFSADVAAATLPGAVGDIEMTFEGDEVYDCLSEPEAELTVDMAGLDTACSALTLGHEWTDCHSIGE